MNTFICQSGIHRQRNTDIIRIDRGTILDITKHLVIEPAQQWQHVY